MFKNKKRLYLVVLLSLFVLGMLTSCSGQKKIVDQNGVEYNIVLDDSIAGSKEAQKIIGDLNIEIVNEIGEQDDVYIAQFDIVNNSKNDIENLLSLVKFFDEEGCELSTKKATHDANLNKNESLRYSFYYSTFGEEVKFISVVIDRFDYK